MNCPPDIFELEEVATIGKIIMTAEIPKPEKRRTNPKISGAFNRFEWMISISSRFFVIFKSELSGISTFSVNSSAFSA